MTRGARARAVLFAVALVAAVAGPAAGPVAVARADVSAQGCSAHAVVVVEPGPGPITICFDGSISGLDALNLAGANPATYGFAGQGAAVCQLFGVGNPSDSSCLIGPGGQYWAYYRAGPGAGGWTYSRAGASTTTVTDGSVEGWRYGTGAAPGFVSFCAVVGCGPPPTEAPPPMQAAPPATAAPATAAPATAAPSNPSSSSGTKDAGKADSGKTKGDSDGGTDVKGETATRGDGDQKGSGTTTTRKSGTKTSDRERSGTVEVAAGGSGGGSDGGSPMGVVIALVVVAVAVTAGLVLRKRRRGPDPG